MLLGRPGAEKAEKAAVRRLLRAGAAARSKVMKNWGVIGGVAAALAASIYVLWGPITERKKRRKGLVPGLLNLGNTCFMNSLLQSLSACPSLINWLEEFTVQTESNQPASSGNQSLSLTLLRLLKALSCQEAPDEDILDASCLLEVLRTYRWQISSFEEQDAHELFHVLTSSLEDERDRQPRVTNLFDVHSLEQPEIPHKQIRCRMRESPHVVSNHWKLQHPFHGRLTSNMVCKHCRHQGGWSSGIQGFSGAGGKGKTIPTRPQRQSSATSSGKSPVRYDTFDSLSLSIPATKWGHPMTLDHCLHHFISSESVKDVVCHNCTKVQAEGTASGQVVENQRTTFVKQLKLGKLPQCLCIHLQRLSWSSHGMPLKRNEHVQFSEFLVMDIYKHRFPVHKLSPRNQTEAPPDGNSPDVEQLDGNKPPLMNGTCSPSLLMSPIVFPFTTVSDYGSPAYLYRLMAVVVHHGDMHSGHFVTYRRSPPSSKTPLVASNQWLWISDDIVRKTTLQEVLSSSAYLLFYERIQPRLQQPSEELWAEE